MKSIMLRYVQTPRSTNELLLKKDHHHIVCCLSFPNFSFPIKFLPPNFSLEHLHCAVYRIGVSICLMLLPKWKVLLSQSTCLFRALLLLWHEWDLNYETLFYFCSKISISQLKIAIAQLKIAKVQVKDSEGTIIVNN